jgi:hypothetical protein
MLASNTGRPVSETNRLPVSLGTGTVTIQGNVIVSTVVSVNSSPSNPVHNHVTEVGTSGILTVPYLPTHDVRTANVRVINLPSSINVYSRNTANVRVTNLPASLNVYTYNTGSANVNIRHANTTPISVSRPLDVRTNTESIYSAPWDMQVARGKVPEVVQVNVFGYAAAVTTDFHTVWEDTPTDVVFPTTAAQWTIVSTSASDNTAASVTIIGLDSNWDAQVETIYLNGTTPVTTTKSFLRVNTFIMNTPGTGQNTNVGVITASSGGGTHAKIAAGFGKMQNAWYSVARATGLYIQNINIFAGEGNQGNQPVWFTYRVVTKNNNTGVQLTILQTPFLAEYKVQRFNPVKYPEKTDVQWQIKTNSGTHGVGVILEAVLIGDAAP